MPTRWQDVVGQVRLFMAQQTSDKSRRDYAQGISGLQQWLGSAEDALKGKPECIHAQLREYVTQLNVRGLNYHSQIALGSPPRKVITCSPFGL